MIRLSNNTDAAHAVAVHAVTELHRRSERLYLTPQNLIEFWAVATRPARVNRLGFSAAQAQQCLTTFQTDFSWLDELPAIYRAWISLVSGLGILGKQVHDARLVAVCHAHGISHLLTLNVKDFTRMAGFGPGLTIVEPHSI